MIAAVGLTTFKLIVGILTNSLGILAEAAHSGLDLVAAAMTYFAVRVSDKPADKEHPFGHGKIENLSALFETCSAGHLGLDHLRSHPAPVLPEIVPEASIWSFIVMGTSIIVDSTRSRILSRAAKI